MTKLTKDQIKEAREWASDWLAHTEEGLNSNDGTWSPEEKKGLEDDRGILLTLYAALDMAERETEKKMEERTMTKITDEQRERAVGWVAYRIEVHEGFPDTDTGETLEMLRTIRIALEPQTVTRDWVWKLAGDCVGRGRLYIHTALAIALDDLSITIKEEK